MNFFEQPNDSQSSDREDPLSQIIPRADREILQGDIMGHFTRAERHLRKAAYRDLQKEVRRLGCFVDSGTPTYHRTYVKGADAILDRQVVFEVLDFSDIGNVAHIITNDEGPCAEPQEGRALHIDECLVSIHAMAFRNRAAILQKDLSDAGWILEPDTGPIVQQRSGRVEILYGNEYSLPLLNLGGSPVPLTELMNCRQGMERATGVLRTLGESSYEPGVFVDRGF